MPASTSSNEQQQRYVARMDSFSSFLQRKNFLGNFLQPTDLALLPQKNAGKRLFVRLLHPIVHNFVGLCFLVVKCRHRRPLPPRYIAAITWTFSKDRSFSHTIHNPEMLCLAKRASCIHKPLYHQTRSVCRRDCDHVRKKKQEKNVHFRAETQRNDFCRHNTHDNTSNT